MNKYDIQRIENALWILNQYEEEISQLIEQSDYSHIRYDFEYAIKELLKNIESE